MHAEIEIPKKQANGLEVISDYVVPSGMVDFKKPADMMQAMMERVMNNPRDKDNILALQSMAEGCKMIVQSGIAQNNQAQTLVELIKVNRRLDLI